MMAGLRMTLDIKRAIFAANDEPVTLNSVVITWRTCGFQQSMPRLTADFELKARRSMILTAARTGVGFAQRRGWACLTMIVASLGIAACNDTRDLAPQSANSPWQTDVLRRDDSAVQVQKPLGEPLVGGNRVFAVPPSIVLPLPEQPADLPSDTSTLLPS